MNEEIAEGSFGLVPTNRPTKTNYLKRSYRLLTKCLVCTDLANTHKHFGGAASCFSCRAFFRRTVRKKEPTKCQGGHKNCVIDLKTRALCALCRFQKCLSVGMDPQRVMKGEELQDKKKIRQGKKKKKKSGESTSSTTTNNFDGETDSDESSTKKNSTHEGASRNNTHEGASSSAAQPKDISELNSYDLDEYLGPVWEAETSTQQLPVPVPDPLPVLNTIDLGVLMESDEETLLETTNTIKTLCQENQETRMSLFQPSTSSSTQNDLPKSIDLNLTTEELSFLQRLLSYKIETQTSQTAIQVFRQFDQFKQLSYLDQSILLNSNMKKYLQYAKAYVISQNFEYDEAYFNSIDVEAQFIGASQLIANLPMNECPFVLMILISFFNAASDLDFEDPYLIKSIQYQFKSMLWRYLCAKMNKQSAMQKMEDYMHMVKLMNNVDEVLKKTTKKGQNDALEEAIVASNDRMISSYPELHSPSNTFSKQESATIEEYGTTFISLLSNILPSQTFSAVPSPSQTFSEVPSPSQTFSAMPPQTFSTMPSQTFSANGINVVITPLSEVPVTNFTTTNHAISTESMTERNNRKNSSDSNQIWEGNCPPCTPGTDGPGKGQLISKCSFGVFKSPKKQCIFIQDFCPSLEKRSNQKNKGTFYC